jgi:hypothetical protein
MDGWQSVIFYISPISIFLDKLNTFFFLHDLYYAHVFATYRLRRAGSELCDIADPFVVMQAVDFGVPGFKLREYRRGQSSPPHYDDTRPIEPNTATLVYEIDDKSN